MASASKRFAGKVVLITGSSTGFGAEFARQFSAEGANVSLTGRNVNNLELVAAQCKKLGAKAITTAGDITSDEVRKKLVENTLSEFGKVDILINNAGLNLGRASILEPDNEGYDIIMDVNMRAVYNLTGLLAKEIVKTKGTIINISSVVGMRPVIGAAPYCAAKAGLDMLTRCWAAELAPHGVRVNGVNPGAFRTEFIRYRSTDKETQNEMYNSSVYANQHALGRVGEPNELAKYVLFLASEDASFMTGINSPCDGGWLLPKPNGIN